ncbi:MAG TPA: MauE/DoxX family redox-associated membrane protein [Anaeromyxobacteraceae bacterium]
MKTLRLLARLFVGGLFLYAAATKLPDMAGFAVDVANYRLLPPALVPFAAVAVVGLELLVGALLLLDVWVRPAALLATALLGLFTGGLTQALLRGIDLDCGCFGAGTRATWWTVLRDVGFLAPALVLALGARGREVGIRPGGRREPGRRPAGPAPRDRESRSAV